MAQEILINKSRYPFDTRSGRRCARWILVDFQFAAGDYLEVLLKIPRWAKRNSVIWMAFAFPVRSGQLRVLRLWVISLLDRLCTGIFPGPPGGIGLKCPERNNQRIQHPSGHSIITVTLTEIGVSDLVLVGTNAIRSFLSNQGTEVNPLFNSFEKIISWIWGFFRSFHAFIIGSLIQIQFIIHSIRNEAASQKKKILYYWF